MNLLPINPLLARDGNLVSLEALRGTLKASPVPLDPGQQAGNVTVSTEQISVSVAAKLGIGSIFSSTLQSDESGYCMDAMQYADSATRNDSGDIVSQTRWGYGLRILCRARKLDTKFSLSFAILGAAVDLGLATVNYEVQTIGLGPTALAAVLNGISQFGALTASTLHDLNTTVIHNLSKIIANPPSALTPRPIAVQLSIPVELDPVVKARSEVFAMRRIRDRMSLKDALARAGQRYDDSAIRAVYQSVEPGIADTATPSDSARQFAKDWMG